MNKMDLWKNGKTRRRSVWTNSTVNSGAVSAGMCLGPRRRSVWPNSTVNFGRRRFCRQKEEESSYEKPQRVDERKMDQEEWEDDEREYEERITS